MQQRTILHVGFGHSGTTSLRKNLLARRDELFYCGQPYGVRGGIFSDVKYKPDYPLYDRARIEELCRSYIFEQASRHQSIAVSDETFVDQPELYYDRDTRSASIILSRLAMASLMAAIFASRIATGLVELRDLSIAVATLIRPTR